MKDLVNMTRGLRIGGDKLDELLTMNQEVSPLPSVVRLGRTFQAKSPLPGVGDMFGRPKVPHEKCQNILDHPEAHSSAKFLQQLREIENETFSVEAAFQVAKAKGIELTKEEKQDLMEAAMEEEKRLARSKLGPEVGTKPSARYIPLQKILDPRLVQEGPFLAPRKVKKQVNPKWHDLRTIQPALHDLWDLRERCPQVSSSSELANNPCAMTWRNRFTNPEESDAWALREATCRAAINAQAMYDRCCLSGPNREPECSCLSGRSGS